MKHGTIYLLYELVCIYTFLSCKLYSVLNLSSISMFPKSTHQTFSTKLFQHFLSHTRFGKEKFSETDFTVSHYAGKVTQCSCTSSCLAMYIVYVISSNIFMQVTYHTNTFLDKNRDYVVLEHCNVLSSSKCPFVKGLFPSLPEESSRSSYKFSSVASRFKVFISITFCVLLNLR
jgi:myosin-5